MSQENAWEREYKNPKLVTKADAPREDLKQYLKYLKKSKGVVPNGFRVLDLGSGTGRNANFLAELGAQVIGFELSETAFLFARERTREKGLNVEYRKADIGKSYDISNESIDLAIDIMSSNSLNEKERRIYLKEVSRVLKPGGYFFVRALCKDGDKNAKNLLRDCPGHEHDTYINREMNLTERVFSENDFRGLYELYFDIEKLIKKTNYVRFGGKRYRRNYWIAYMKKPSKIRAIH